jgi:uncharacterized FlgJ-related protein
MNLTAISAQETGLFTSPIYKNNHNLFGMRLAKQRDTLAIGDKSGYANYNSNEDSIKDMLLWFAYHNQDPGSFTSLKDMIHYMKEKKYFEGNENKYYDYAENWKKELESEL